MKKILLLACLGVMGIEGFGGKTTLITRSQTVDAARVQSGWRTPIDSCNLGLCSWSLSAAAQYQRSFSQKRLVDYMLGGCRNFAVTGSRIAGRGANDILADYFGLPQDYASVIHFSPHISNFLVDFDWTVGLDSLCGGLFFRIQAPVVYANWDLGFTETVCNPGTAFYPAGYMGPTRINRTDLPLNFDAAIEGHTTFGDMQSKLAYGKIFERQTRAHLSDIAITLGYNAYDGGDVHLGVGLRILAPAGNRPSPEFLFSPVIGNGRHWELGGELTGDLVLWRNTKHDEYVSVFLTAWLTHLFASYQMRAYDLITSGSGSRYMLLTETQPVAHSNLFINGQMQTTQYAGKLYPAINITTLRSKIGIPFQADVLLKVSYYRCGLFCDIGYDMWYRSGEKLLKRCMIRNNSYALKGDEQLYGFITVNSGAGNVGDAVRLNATEHLATLNGGQAPTNFVSGVQFANRNVDSAVLASDSALNPLNQLNSADSIALGIPAIQVSGSANPILLTDADIDNCSALVPHAMTHKIFAYVGYVWDNCEEVAPSVGIGGDAEVRGGLNNNSGINMWSIWLKGMVAF